MKSPILFVLLLTFFISCTDNDDEVTVVDTALEGKWALTNASCFCFFGDDFDFSEHKLDFDTKERMLTIENSENTQFIRSSGTYDFTLKKNSITINGNLKYTYVVNGNKLELSFIDNPDIADDEITLFYTKN
jgi:hypothetical protein